MVATHFCCFVFVTFVGGIEYVYKCVLFYFFGNLILAVIFLLLLFILCVSSNSLFCMYVFVC